MPAYDPILTALFAMAIASMLFGFGGTFYLTKALPFVRPGVSRAVAATAIKRPFRSQPLDALFLPEGLAAAHRGFLLGRVQYALMAAALLMLILQALA